MLPIQQFQLSTKQFYPILMNFTLSLPIQFQLLFFTSKSSIQNTIPDQLHIITSHSKKSHQNAITDQLYIINIIIPIFMILKFN